MPPRKDPEKTRLAIRTAAIAQFLQQGYEASTLDDIAKTLGLTRQGVLYHYGTKEALLRSIVEPVVVDFNRVMDELPQEPATDRAQRRYVVRRMLDPLCEHREAMALILRFSNGCETMQMGEMAYANNTRAARMLVGDAMDTDIPTRIRVVALLSALTGVMGARLTVPLESCAEREILADALVAMLEDSQPVRAATQLGCPQAG